MAPRKARWRDNPDYFMVRGRCEQLILQYLDWMDDNDGTIDETIDLCGDLGEALIDLGEIMGITVHIYGEDVAVGGNKP